MIITRLLGGLGNQMFQYAGGLALAHRRRTVLKLDVSWFREDPAHADHNRYGLSCFNITEQFATQVEVARLRGRPQTRAERWLAAVARTAHLPRLAELHAAGGRWHSQRQLAFYPEFFDQPDDTYLDGMWQAEEFFGSELPPLLRKHFSFRYPLGPETVALAERIGAGPSAAVHFRRGDYVTNPQFNREIGVVGLEYYTRAVALLRSRHPGVTLYVFSDDIAYAEEHFRPPGPCVFVANASPLLSFEKIHLIARCEHQVISNSTFAWWGAWLNANPGKTVIAPDPWLAGKPAESAGTVPASWIRLPGSG